jgi:hypothetical protein
MNSAVLTKEHQHFIEENLTKMNPRQIAEAAGVEVRFVRMYLQKKNLKALPCNQKEPRSAKSFEQNGFFDIDAYKYHII